MQFNWIFFLLQTIHVLSVEENEISGSPLTALLNTFRYNFKKLPKVGKVIFWKISKDKQTFRPQMYVKYITQFKSNETYLIFTKTRDMYISIYYWLGIDTLLDDRKEAAKYAALQYTLLREYTDSLIDWRGGDLSMSREVEAMESESFHNTINFVNRSGVGRQYVQHIYLDSEYISRYPNLYVVRGDTTTRIKKVPIGTSWFRSDICLVLESGYTIQELSAVNMYCGPSASEKANKRAEAFSDVLNLSYIRFFLAEPINIIDSPNKNEPKFKVLMEVLENKRYYKSYEVDLSNDHLKVEAKFVADRDEAVKLFWIKHRTIHVEATNETKTIFEMHEDKTGTFLVSQFIYGRETGIGFIFDSSSIAGLIVHIHHDNNLEERIAIMAMVEDYIEEKYSSSSIPQRVRIVRESRPGYFTIDFLINLIAWPIHYADQYGLELVHW